MDSCNPVVFLYTHEGMAMRLKQFQLNSHFVYHCTIKLGCMIQQVHAETLLYLLYVRCTCNFILVLFDFKSAFKYSFV